jgi:hypothetical protein
VLITPEQLKAAHKRIAEWLETTLKNRSYTLNGGCVLTVTTRGKAVTQRDEAFVGDESFMLRGVYVASPNYNEHKSVVIFQPSYPAEFSYLQLDTDQATLHMKGFGREYLGALDAGSTDAKVCNALRVIEQAKQSGVTVASKETISDLRFGSW